MKSFYKKSKEGEGLNDFEMLKYFWEEKGDFTRYIGYEYVLETLKSENNPAYNVIYEYVKAKHNLDSMFSNIDLYQDITEEGEK